MPVDRLPELLALAERSPRKPLVWYGLAMEYRGRERFDDALQAFSRCLEVDPKYVPAFFQAGLTLEQCQRRPEAVAMLRRGIEAAAAKGDRHARGEMQEVLDTWGEA